MKFCYCDPPYLGSSVKHYGTQHPEASAYDDVATHAALITRLVTEFPDGWALSASTVSLKRILALCPDDVRIGAWVKPFAIFKPNVNPGYAWEPVIWRGGRDRTREQLTVRDWVSASITLETGTAGAKPDAFAVWIFELLGMQEDDELVDLFPGSGAVSRAWRMWRDQLSLVS